MTSGLKDGPSGLKDGALVTTFPNARTMQVVIRVHSVVELGNVFSVLGSKAVQDAWKAEAAKHFGGAG